MASLYSRKAVFCRIDNVVNQIGRESIQPDENTIIRYNWRPNDAPTFIGLLRKHAAENGGRLLIPFGNRVSIKSVKLNTWFIAWSTDGEWVKGRIHDTGVGYVTGMDDHDGYTAPAHVEHDVDKWVKLDDVTGGDNDFPLDDYTYEAYEVGVGPKPPVSLREAMKRSNFNTLFITRKEEE